MSFVCIVTLFIQTKCDAYSEFPQISAIFKVFEEKEESMLKIDFNATIANLSEFTEVLYHAPLPFKKKSEKAKLFLK